uniref:Retrotransposon gag domain-containing protein n=1 Tax=Vitis vinifera TaxID=29760 RepID=A5AQX1_VITVI|nr:hypothetical protein VITISV_012466 [Vitis vinifera]
MAPLPGMVPRIYASSKDRLGSCIVLPNEPIVIKTHLVPLLPQFHGMKNENPYTYIKDFEKVCHTFHEGNTSIELMKLKLFPFTLTDKAKLWFNSLRPQSITSWLELQTTFLKKFFPTHRTSGLKRYMEVVNACPHHGFDTWMLVSYFYEGMSPTMKQLLETICGGDFMSKSPDEAFEFLNYVAEISRSWDEPHERDLHRSKSQSNSKGGMYMLNENVDLQAKMIVLTKRLEELEAKGFHEVNAIYDNPIYMEQCSSCQSIEHELAISKLTSMHTVQEKGKFSSQPQQNPSGAHEIGETSESSTKEDEVKAIITLRGGKQVDQPMPKPRENKEGEQKENVKEQEKRKEVNEDDRSKEDEIVKEEVKKKDMLLAPPFPMALQSKKVVNNALEIFEVLKQVKVNIALLDMIRQVPAYAKFLKDLIRLISQPSLLIKNIYKTYDLILA